MAFDMISSGTSLHEIVNIKIKENTDFSWGRMDSKKFVFYFKYYKRILNTAQSGKYHCLSTSPFIHPGNQQLLHYFLREKQT